MQFRQLIESKEQELLEILKKEIKKQSLEMDRLREENAGLAEQCITLENAHQNNIHVIEEIEEENRLIRDKALQIKNDNEDKDKVIRELNQRIRSIEGRIENQARSMKAEIDKLKAERDKALQELIGRGNKADDTKLIIQKLELKHKIEMEQVSQFAAQKIRSEQAQSSKALNSLRNQTDKIIRDLKIKLEGLVSQNKQLLETHNILKESSLEKETTLTQKVQALERANKQSEYCKGIYEQELQNVKKTSETWEQTLKDKIKSLQSQKQQFIEELAQYKLQKKQKTRQLKEQFAQKIDELMAEKTKSMKRYEQVVRDTKIENQKLIFANSQLKKQVSDVQRNKKTFEAETQNRMNQYLKNAEQDRRFAKNELELKQERVYELQRQLSDCQKVNTDQKTIIDKLKQTLDKRSAEHQALKLEFNKYKTTMRQKLMKQQHIQAQKQQQQDNQEYSQYFSEDMGPIDSMWFERNSNLPQKKPLQQPQPQGILNQVYDNKRTQALEKENSELKDIVSRMSRQMQDTRDTIAMKLDLKDKEIRLMKDENYMLRDKINEKEQEILRIKNRLNQAELELGKTQQKMQMMKLTDSESKETRESLKKIEEEFKNIKEELEEAIEHNRVLLQQRETLIAISNDLRAELNYAQQQLQNMQPSMMLGMSSNKPEEKRVSDASVRQINRMLEGHANNAESQIYVGQRTRKQQRRLSPNQQPTVIKMRQNKNSENTPNRKPQSLASLIRQRKNLIKEERNRQPFKIQLVAEQAQIHQPKKQRTIVETQSQKEAFEKVRQKSKEKEAAIQQKLNSFKPPRENVNPIKDDS